MNTSPARRTLVLLLVMLFSSTSVVARSIPGLCFPESRFDKAAKTGEPVQPDSSDPFEEPGSGIPEQGKSEGKAERYVSDHSPSFLLPGIRSRNVFFISLEATAQGVTHADAPIYLVQHTLLI